MMPPVFVELCCGSAATSLCLWGAEPPFPYQGSKTRYAPAILHKIGITTPPERVVLVDTGEWADAWRVLMDRTTRPVVVDLVAGLVSTGEDPRELWERLRTAPVPVDPLLRVAVWTVLQRLAFSGKAVAARPDGSGWDHPGFNPTHAYGRAATDTFGALEPQLPALPSRLAALPWLPVEAHRLDVRRFLPPADATGWVVYFDPPYAGTTGYGADDLTRDEVLDVAVAWRARGAIVVVSEAEPLDLPGWHCVDISSERVGKVSSWQRPEWLTMSRGPAQLELPLAVA